MKMTPAIKGQLTKAVRATEPGIDRPDWLAKVAAAIRSIFSKHMPREQAKHATRKYMRTLQVGL